jgi:hypothetical protein
VTSSFHRRRSCAEDVSLTCAYLLHSHFPPGIRRVCPGMVIDILRVGFLALLILLPPEGSEIRCNV